MTKRRARSLIPKTCWERAKLILFEKGVFAACHDWVPAQTLLMIVREITKGSFLERPGNLIVELALTDLARHWGLRRPRTSGAGGRWDFDKKSHGIPDKV